MTKYFVYFILHINISMMYCGKICKDTVDREIEQIQHLGMCKQGERSVFYRNAKATWTVVIQISIAK